MLVELGVVEQRYDAVKEVLDGGSTVSEVAERYGVTRQSLHNWLRLPARKGSEIRSLCMGEQGPRFSDK